MQTKQNILDEVKKLLAPGEYEIKDLLPGDPIPGQGDNRVDFKNTGVRFEAVTMYIDMRGSTKILQAHKVHNVAKVHKAFLYVGTTMVHEHGGHIRSYNGDSILAFFRGSSKDVVAKAISAAMQMVYLCARDEVAKAEFARYSAVDFGIGIDVGHIVCAKAGRGGNGNHSDMIWLGDPVNRSTVLSDRGRDNSRIWISNAIRDLQNDAVRIGSDKKDMWAKSVIKYVDVEEVAWCTSYAQAVT